MRHWLELSMTTHPDFAAMGAHVLDRSAPAEKRARSMPSNECSCKVSTGTSLPSYSRIAPSDRSDAKRRNFSMGNFLSSHMAIISLPTAPVAPTTPTTYVSFFFSIYLLLTSIIPVAPLFSPRLKISECGEVSTLPDITSIIHSHILPLSLQPA